MNVDRILKFELNKLNVHLPKRRISLKEALESTRPKVATRDGSVHRFKREELDFLAGVVPEVDWGRLQLPILIALDPKFGRGAARITGAAEVMAISQILGKKSTGEELLIYRPDVAIIRRKLPTTTQYIFMPG
jgi:uncharacterized protein (UPF0216 family)